MKTGSEGHSYESSAVLAFRVRGLGFELRTFLVGSKTRLCVHAVYFETMGTLNPQR